MGKSDDSIARRKDKRNRRKQESKESKVSNRIASIIAAKKRRQSGKRRICQSSYGRINGCLIVLFEILKGRDKVYKHRRRNSFLRSRKVLSKGKWYLKNSRRFLMTQLLLHFPITLLWTSSLTDSLRT